MIGKIIGGFYHEFQLGDITITEELTEIQNLLSIAKLGISPFLSLPIGLNQVSNRSDTKVGSVSISPHKSPKTLA
jgi:uncharacterized membrane protein YczE